MIIPYQSLNKDTLRSIIEEFVTREGTDYGDIELSIEDKVRSIETKLSLGEVVIMYIECTETVNIVDSQRINSY